MCRACGGSRLPLCIDYDYSSPGLWRVTAIDECEGDSVYVAAKRRICRQYDFGETILLNDGRKPHREYFMRKKR